jgi:predicted nuclease of predicted toxin-antitoxin system
LNLLADEGVDRQIVERLRREGHSVSYVAEMDPGIPDAVVLDLAARDAAVLLTSDRDFGELVFRQGRAHPGVILVRLAGLPPSTKAETVARAVAEHTPEYEGAFAVISAGSVRIRRRT